MEEINKCLYDKADEIIIKKPLTVDHILPQAWEKNEYWEKLLLNGVSDDEKEARRDLIDNTVNTIGNLTLMTGVKNSKKSNRSFQETKDFLEDSDLKMNRQIADFDKWDEEEIRRRGSMLADIVCKRWVFIV